MAIPTIVSATVQADGESIIVVFSEPVLGGAGYSPYYWGTASDWEFHDENVFLDTSTAQPSDTYLFTLKAGKKIYSGENVTLDYQAGANEATSVLSYSDNEYLRNLVSPIAMTNNSELALPQVRDVLDDLQRASRVNASKDKIICVYNSANGSTDEALIDAYFDEWGITNHIKYPVDFSIAATWDSDLMWGEWLSDFADTCVANDIEQVAVGPSTPSGGHKPIIIIGTATALSGIVGSIYIIKAYMDANPSETSLRNQGFSSNDINYNDGLEKTNLNTSDDSAADFNVFGDEGLRRETGVNTYEINGIRYEDFDTTAEDAYNFKIKTKAYVSSAVRYNQFQGYKKHSRIPAWRIGYYKLPTSLAPDLTTTIIRTMVQNSKASVQTLSYHAANSPTVGNAHASEAFRVQQTMYFDYLLDNLGFVNRKFGYNTQRAGQLENEPGRPVFKTGLTQYEYQETPAADGTIDFTWTNASTETGTDDSTNQYIPAADVGSGFPDSSQPIGFHAHTTGTTFPLDAFLFFDQSRNWLTAGSGKFITDVIKPAPGGIRMCETSHGQRMAPWWISEGGSVCWGSLAEPGATAVSSSLSFMIKMLQGYTAAEAYALTATTFMYMPELYGDGLAQPFKFEAEPINGNRKMRHNFITRVDELEFDTSVFDLIPALPIPATTTQITGSFLGLRSLNDAGYSSFFTLNIGELTRGFPTDDNGVTLWPYVTQSISLEDHDPLEFPSFFMANVRDTDSILGDFLQETSAGTAQTGFCIGLPNDGGDIVPGSEMPFSEIVFEQVGNNGADEVYTPADFSLGIAADGAFTSSAAYTKFVLYFLSGNTDSNAIDLAALDTGSTGNGVPYTYQQMTSAEHQEGLKGYITYNVNPDASVGGGKGSSKIISHNIIS